VLDEQMLLPY